jgi:Transglycosylase-like domain
VCLSLLSTVTATVVVPSERASADQVSDLKAQATQIAQDLVLEQLQIGVYRQHYDVDAARVQRDQAEIGSSQARIQSDATRVNRDRARLQSEAVWAYINLDPQVSRATQALFEDPKDAPTRAEYEQVATGDIALAMDSLRTDESALRAQRATLEQQESQDQAILNQQATLASAARQSETQLESKQSEITGQLAVAVAQQQAAQAAAAAAAVRKAQAAAASTSQASPGPSTTSTTSTTSTKTGGSTTSSDPTSPTSPVGASTGDPALPPFLQCVLRVESGGNYGAVSPGGTYMGGFQFSQPTWNAAAQLAGMPQLVDVPPNQATPAQQDDLAIALYQADGEQPWNDSCQNH